MVVCVCMYFEHLPAAIFLLLTLIFIQKLTEYVVAYVLLLTSLVCVCVSVCVQTIMDDNFLTE